MSNYQSEKTESRKTLPPRSAGGLGGSAFLGNTLNYTAPPETLALQAISRRLEKFELQSIASSILRPFPTKDKTGNFQLPRVCKCLNVRRSKYVEVWQSAKNNLAYYGGLVICGSVWDCLPCASKIAIGRAEEIKLAVETWEGQGNTVVMLTQTFPHYENQKCKPLRQKFGIARIKQKNTQSWRKLKKEKGLAGEIYRVEVTHGQNGWHVHSHSLLFLTGKQTVTENEIYPSWAGSCVASGLPSPSKEHGVKISTPEEKAAYIAKQGKDTSNWTLEAEMTKGHIKRGGREGMTPFDLLRAFRDTNEDKYANLFLEYSQTFKGTQQLVWSKGLRSLLHLVDEVTDQELAEGQDEQDKMFSLIPDKLWEWIRKQPPQRNYRGKLLEALNKGEETFIQALQVLQTAAGYVELPF